MVTKARNPDRTRRAILDAAVAEFAAVGPAGARIDAIAAAAGVNKRMLYHYFASKEGLFAAVLDDQLGSTRSDAPPASLAERYAAVSGRPDWIRLLMWEALAGDDRRRGASRAPDNGLRPAGHRNELETPHRELAYTALALCPFAFPQLTRLITGASPADPEFAASWSAFLTALEARIERRAEAIEAAKPRFRLAANVTESPPQSAPRR
jgi:TetR/AcrR family transcriptional regulator